MNTTHLCSPPYELLEQVRLAKTRRSGCLLGLVERLTIAEVEASVGSLLRTGPDMSGMGSIWSSLGAVSDGVVSKG